MIRIAGIVQNSIVDGEGLRFTVFTQGCPHHCPGCHNPQTWGYDGGKKISIEEIKSMIEEDQLIYGITFSGGEPFEQAGELAKLAEWAHKNAINVWCYTGWTIEELISRNKHDELKLLKNVDVLIDGRFEVDKKSFDVPWRGSRNQRLWKLKEGNVIDQL